MEEGGKYLGGCFKAKTFSRGGIEGVDKPLQIIIRETIGLGFQRDKAADTAVHIFDAALLPSAVRTAEISLDAERIELMVEEKLGAVILG